MTIQEFFKGDAFAAEAGVELLDVKKGYARARMRITPRHLNGGGVCQGGAIFTLADLAAAAATNSHARLALSIESSIHFIRGEKEGFLYAEAKEMDCRKRLSYCEVKVMNEAGDLVASFGGTAYRKEEALPFTPMENE